ncbi:type II toxin-antitoxin system VapC family toxin [Natrialba swarupiae]|uniref:Type II toxin-antitoxin system VapC family toxin n=1 Tax=Natrialba swarupiae TaxID=2448032 RepID=A0A5D5AHW4_9EURY|nr:type II toxin-antitoxin system VapC family toxin [Natrialba swarupiae]TYT61389.1 type II toxin-antitoxin system VapC family toxin [Natrialba swarupiae]
MTVLVDTGVLYADHDTDAARHNSASEALDAVYDGRFGLPYVSDYIYDEAITLTLKRGGSFVAAKRLGERLRGADPYPQTYELIHVSAAAFSDSIDIFEQYDDQSLSFTDATTIALSNRHDIDYVMSFDDDFDGTVPRLDPADV